MTHPHVGHPAPTPAPTRGSVLEIDPRFAQAFGWGLLVVLFATPWLSLLAAVAPLVGWRALTGWTPSEQLYLWLVVGSQVLALAVIAGVVHQRLRASGLTLAAVGLRRFRWTSVIAHVLGFFGLLLAFGITLALVAIALGVDAPTRAERGGAGFLPMLIVGVLLAPLIEEVLHRGIILPRLAAHLPFPVAAMLSAAIFAASHVTPAQIVFTFPMGLYLAWAYRRTGSIVPGMVVHALWNLFVYAVQA